MLHDNKAPGCDGIPIEAYRGSPAAKQELFAIVRLMWQTEVIPPAVVCGTFVMLYKKGPRDNFANYRAIGLICHSYKLLSMLVLHRMRDAVESRLAETQAGFRRERGCHDNVLLLRLLMDAVLRAGKQAVVTFIDYRAAFDTISHRFLDSWWSTAQYPPHSEGHLRGSNRDGASALAERRDSVFRAVSRQTRCHSGRHLQPAVFYTRVGSTFQAASAALLPPVIMEGESLESVYQFDYLGCRFTSDGDDAADMRHRMAIAGERSRSLNYLGSDNRLPLSLKLRLYAASVCSTLTHGSEAWMLTPRRRRRRRNFI